jgi:hypothetical protein
MVSSWRIGDTPKRNRFALYGKFLRRSFVADNERYLEFFPSTVILASGLCFAWIVTFSLFSF